MTASVAELAPYVARRVVALIGLCVLGGLICMIHQVPPDPYYAQTLMAWEGGRFIRFEKLRGIFRKAIRASDYANATPEMRKTMSNLVAVDLGGILHSIKCPTLIIWGAGDTTTPLADGELMHRGIPQSRMRVISGARHGPHITHTKEIADLIVHELQA